MTDVQDDGSPASSDVIHEPANSNTVFELSKLLQRDQRVMRDFVQDAAMKSDVVSCAGGMRFNSSRCS